MTLWSGLPQVRRRLTKQLSLMQRAWLEKHGVVKSKTANTRDELLDLMARNYYGARDTRT